MLEREQMSAKNLNIKLNLVGFSPDLTDKFTKQIDAINRMNMAQNRLQHHWEIGQHSHLCQVHFVIESSLPHYLKNTQDPVLSNQNLDVDNLIPCPHPITTFDLIDMLALTEQKLSTESQANTNQTPQMTFWRAGSVVSTPVENAANTEIITSNKSEPEPEPETNTVTQDKPVFYTYGSFRKSQTTEPTTTPNQPESSSHQEAAQIPSHVDYPHPESTTEAVSVAATPPAADTETKKETFILYGSLKNKTDQKKTAEIAVPVEQTAATNIVVTTKDIPKQTPDSNTTIDVVTPEPLPITAASTPMAIIPTDSALTTPQSTFDIWETLSQHSHGIMHIESFNVSIDYDKKIIAAAVSDTQELVHLLFKTCPNDALPVASIPTSLKQFSLPSILWSYGLHTPKHAEQTQKMDFDNQEWKLKGFPRFGQWETHPTWLFLATLFAQQHQSVYAATMKGKASHQQVKHFIYAAHLAGLIWQTQALNPEKKQEQQALLHQAKPDKDSWITRLREKLNINEHFESSID